MGVDFLSVGDTTTDAFVNLEDANAQDGLLCMRFGDKIPYKDAEILHGVGNAANAAVSAARLSVKSSLLTAVGDDMRGNLAISSWQKEGIDTSPTLKFKDIPTNYHFVLRYGPERTILIKHEKYPYEFEKPNFTPKMVYLTSLGGHTLDFQKDLVEWAQKEEILLAFQPGTFQIKTPLEKIKFAYEASYLFFANKQEYQQILQTNEDDEKKLLKDLRQLGPKYLVLTDGPSGIYAYDGENFYHLPQYPDPAPPKDRTGAGDAFSSTVAAMMLKGKSFQEALMYGPINSMSVVQHIGAQKGLLSTSELERLLQSAPEDYKLKLI